MMIIENEYFDPLKTFDCGQCFRFNKTNENTVTGIAGKQVLTFEKSGKKVTVTGCENESFLKNYLALDEDYAKINEDIFSHFGRYNDVIFEAEKASRGIRILRQDKWETLCSFIISQNNNIGRIKKIVEAICSKCGEPFEDQGKVWHAFPSAETVAALSEDELKSLGTGFRAAYILDAAKKVADRKIDLDKISPDNYEDAVAALTSVKGVGPKVAACTMLFGYHALNAFPIDVWIKRVLEKYYSAGIDLNGLGCFAGIAQQYLFYYERYSENVN